jgi:hypothetical protein
MIRRFDGEGQDDEHPAQHLALGTVNSRFQSLKELRLQGLEPGVHQRETTLHFHPQTGTKLNQALLQPGIERR